MGDTITLTQLQQKRVWDGQLSAEIRANYFAELSGTYRWHQRLANWLSLVFSSGALATFILKDGLEITPYLPWLRPVLAFLTAGFSVYSIIAQNQDRATNCTDLHFRWNKLAKEFEALWDDMYSESAAARLVCLEATATELSKAGNTFPNRKRKLVKWQDYVEMRHTSNRSA